MTQAPNMLNAPLSSTLSPTTASPTLVLDAAWLASAEDALVWLSTLLASMATATPTTTLPPLTLLLGQQAWQLAQLQAVLDLAKAHATTVAEVVAVHPATRHAAKQLGLAMPSAHTLAKQSPQAYVQANHAQRHDAKVAIPSLPTHYVRQSLRSGQSVASPGHLVLVGDVNPGAELSAVGDILVFGDLKGVAVAGCQGDASACIAALRLDALQLRVANALARRPDAATSQFEIERGLRYQEAPCRPEIALCVEGEIRIYPWGNHHP